MKGCSLTVCRGCCCGTDDPHAASAWLRALRRALPSTKIQVSDCLGPCDHRDVIVIRPQLQGKHRSHRPVWLAWMGSQSALEDLVTWVKAGGPGQAPCPGSLELNTFLWRRGRAVG